MKKISLLVSALLLVSMISFSQTVKENIRELSKDPKTSENAAKADVYILKNKKVINDSCSAKPSIATGRKKKNSRKGKN